MIAAILIAFANVAVTPADLAQVKSYDGKNVWTHVGDAKSFLDIRVVRDAIDVQLNVQERRLLRQLSVGDEVGLAGRFMTANVCMPHDCPTQHVTIAVDTRDGVVFFGFWTRKAWWVSPAGRTAIAPKALPCSVLEVFHFAHTPYMQGEQWCERAEPPWPPK